MKNIKNFSRRINWARKIFEKGIFALRYLYHLLFSSFHHLGKRVIFESDITVTHGDRISLGDNVHLYKDVTLQIIDGYKNSYETSNIIIGDGVRIGPSTIIAAAKFIHIKKNVLVGPHCFIGDHDHEYHNINIPIKDQGYRDVKKIVIEEGAWIASCVTICSGVTIGKNSVVGANSVVIEDIPPFSVAVGSPAKIIKQFNKNKNKWEVVF